MSETYTVTPRVVVPGHEPDWNIQGPGIERLRLDSQEKAAELADNLGRVRDAALEWAAGQVEEAGCLCLHLWRASDFKGEAEWIGADLPGAGRLFKVTTHDHRCPKARAAKIRKGRP